VEIYLAMLTLLDYCKNAHKRLLPYYSFKEFLT
jgi:hypothetical protein